MAAGLTSLVLAGCGGGVSQTGAGGAGGHPAGGGGQSGAGGGSAGGGSGNLPACALAARPSDPDGGTSITATGDTCNSITLPSAVITSELLGLTTDAGIVLDGGALEGPTGGTILDGDYDMIRQQTTAITTTQRRIRVFGGGAYIEWAVKQPDNQIDAGMIDLRYDTTSTNSGANLAFAYSCGAQILIDSFGFTATNDELVFFSVQRDISDEYAVVSVDTYQRTCAR